MDMHDKDIDQLFRSQLGDIEAEPSARVWKNIAAGLDEPAAKRSLVPYLRIAASVVIVLGAGLWLMLNPGRQGPAGVSHRRLAAQQNHQPKQVLPVSIDDQGQTATEAEQGTRATELPRSTAETVNQLTAVHQSSKSTISRPVAIKPAHADSSINTAANQPQLASVTSTTKPAVQAVVPDVIAQPKPALTEDNAFRTTATTVDPAKTMAAISPDRPKTKRHGIHSLGDVVNLVVAKVDKREDKLIEFTDTDDDEAEVTGINLGLFRVKKQK